MLNATRENVRLRHVEGQEFTFFHYGNVLWLYLRANFSWTLRLRYVTAIDASVPATGAQLCGCWVDLVQEMIKKFGVKELASPKKKANKTKKEADVKTEKKIGRKRKSADIKDEAEDEEEEESDGEKKAKKPRKNPEATCEANQPLADAFAELSGFEFKRGERFKGGTWSKVAKAIRDCESELTCGKDALKLKGVGKSSAAKIDEFLETGTLEKLEEYRAGNM
jgi:hypothetical protein